MNLAHKMVRMRIAGNLVFANVATYYSSQYVFRYAAIEQRTAEFQRANLECTARESPDEWEANLKANYIPMETVKSGKVKMEPTYAGTCYYIFPA